MEERFQQGLAISLYVCILGTLAETVLFLMTMHKVRNIKQEFSMRKEIMVYAFSWFVLTNLSVGLYVQFSGVISLPCCDRIRSYLLILRSLSAVAITTIKPITQSYHEKFFFPIPPNKECIESVDELLHIPIAVDAFFHFLVQLPEHESIKLFALYIDLRRYD